MNNSSIFVSKEVRSAIMKAMSKTQRRWAKQGEVFAIRIIRKGRAMKRWGDDNNTAKIAIDGKGKLYRNSLEALAWNWDENKARIEAANALDYFVYGDKDEYEVVIM